MEVKKYLESQFRTQSILLNEVERVVYGNPKHIRGIEPYYTKKKLRSMMEKVRFHKRLLTADDFKLLQSIVQEYSN